VQKEGDVIHVVCEELEDLTPMLRSVGGRDTAVLSVPHGRGDQVTHPGGPDSGEEAALGGRRARDIYVRELDLESIKGGRGIFVSSTAAQVQQAASRSGPVP
jgi:error-prone DNA polymerase